MQRQPPRIPYIQSNPTNLLQCPIHSNYNLQITGIIIYYVILVLVNEVICLCQALFPYNYQEEKMEFS